MYYFYCSDAAEWLSYYTSFVFLRSYSTASSIAGDAFVRWMTTKSVRRDEGGALPIATHNKIGDIENMTLTQDEVGYIYIYLSFWARLFSFF